ncbi:MAG: hypothetical protein J6A58_05330 [Oscillospiraceae bacterium]|nr:hypothetical protein [Oscillospiraceae bacterium]
MKIIGDTHDLLNDSGLDEMQKAYAYNLAFKCFKAMYCIMFVISFVMVMLAVAVEESVIFAVTALVIELLINMIYIIFGIKSSKIGAINPMFSKYMARPGTIVGYVILGVVYSCHYFRDGELFGIVAGIYMIILVATFIILGAISKKNNKIINQAEDEET